MNIKRKAAIYFLAVLMLIATVMPFSSAAETSTFKASSDNWDKMVGTVISVSSNSMKVSIEGGFATGKDHYDYLVQGTVNIKVDSKTKIQSTNKKSIGLKDIKPSQRVLIESTKHIWKDGAPPVYMGNTAAKIQVLKNGEQVVSESEMRQFMTQRVKVLEHQKDKNGNTSLLVERNYKNNMVIGQADLVADVSLSGFAVGSILEISYLASDNDGWKIKWITSINRVTDKAPNPFSDLNAANIKGITYEFTSDHSRDTGARIQGKQDIQEIVRLLQSVNYEWAFLDGGLDSCHTMTVTLTDGSKKVYELHGYGDIGDVVVTNHDYYSSVLQKIDTIQKRHPRISWLNNKLKLGKSAPNVNALEITKSDKAYKKITKTEDMQRMLDALQYPNALYFSNVEYKPEYLLSSITVGNRGAFSIFKYQDKYYVYMHNPSYIDPEVYEVDKAWAEKLVSLYDAFNYPAKKIEVDDGPDEWADSAPTGKPVIYLYPEKTQDVSVKLDFKGELSYTYPTYNDGWNVTASPDGTLINKSDGSTHYYLFWDGYADFNDWDFSTGFVVKGSDIESFFEDKLPKMGLTPREYNDFITYWVPRLAPNAYNLITFATAQYEAIAPLDITPKPDTVLRVHMVYKPIATPVAVKEQVLPKAPERKGFTVVEWGATRAR